MKNYCQILVLLVLVPVFLTGCVERMITVTSDPVGATVWLNDQEVGVTPVSVPFTYYGDYAVTLRMDKYQTLNTHKWAKTPFYELPVIDFFSECLWPGTLKDNHSWHFEMCLVADIDRDALINRAVHVRQQASEK